MKRSLNDAQRGRGEVLDPFVVTFTALPERAEDVLLVGPRVVRDEHRRVLAIGDPLVEVRTTLGPFRRDLGQRPVRPLGDLAGGPLR